MIQKRYGKAAIMVTNMIQKKENDYGTDYVLLDYYYGTEGLSAVTATPSEC